MEGATTIGAAWDAATQELPPDLVNNMLLDRYIEKYTRLGLGGHMNGPMGSELVNDGY